MSKKIITTHQYRSSSDANVFYSVLRFSDGTVTCNCPLFKREQSNGEHWCKHVGASGEAKPRLAPLVPLTLKVKPSLKHGASMKVSKIKPRLYGFEED